MIKIPRNDIEWRDVNYLVVQFGEGYHFKLTLNKPLADWDVYDYWERERVEHMMLNLNQGEIFFDIGTEQGWLNLAYAKIVGPENMVLIEPTKEFWANINALWYKNYDKDPKAFYNGLFSNKTTDKRTADEFNKWSDNSTDAIIDRNKYTYIHENSEKTPEIKLDDYVSKTGIVPDVLNIDVEGAELLVLQGAKKTLKDNNLKVYVSIHDDLGLRDYKVEPGDTQKYLESLGYKGDYLATDHEAHWYFEK